jgi:hypothetical protein
MNLGNGFSCPRKVLINSDIHQIDLKDPGLLFNANTPTDKEKAINKLNA